MKIITWNVNSVRARLRRVTALLASHWPDLACLQEIKTSSGEFPAGDFAAVGYEAAVHGQAGRNGVAILARIPMADVACGFPGDPVREQARKPTSGQGKPSDHASLIVTLTPDG